MKVIVSQSLLLLLAFRTWSKKSDLKVLKSILLITSIVLLNLSLTGQNKFHQSYFKHSFISLMPEGEPDQVKAFLPLKPSVVAWGMDPLNSNIQDLTKEFDSYKAIGISQLACNVWMLTATEKYMYLNPEFQKAICRDIAGNPIIPGWLDSEYKGIKPWWGCTNNPLYQKLIKDRVVLGIKSGANMLHLDDHMGTSAAVIHSGACFCDDCMNGFNAWLKTNFSKDELNKKGISNIQDFNYAALIKSDGFTTLDSYKKGIAQNKIPLRDEFLLYQLYSAAELVGELGKIADSTAGRHIPLGVNSWNLDATQLATSHYADYFANEVSHFDVENLIPPFVYMLSTALGKPVFSTGTGEDWIHIRQHEQPVRVGRWISTAYAFGQYFMYAYNKWGFSEKTGTQWYQTPIKMYEPWCSFITKNADLFDGFEPVDEVGVLYENEVCRNNNWSVRTICRELNDKNIPVGLAVSGDSWMKHELTMDQMDKFRIVVLPEETNLTEKEEIMMKELNKQGRLIKWTNAEDLISKIPKLISISKTDQVWTLPRFRKSDSGKMEYVIHLLNQDYNAEKDVMNVRKGFDVLFSDELTKGKGVSKISFFEPGEESKSLKINKTAKGFYVTVPHLNVWAIIKIE